MKAFPKYLLPIFAGLVIIGCQPDQTEGFYGLTHYPQEVDKVIRLNCATSGCHVEGGESPNLATWERVMAGGEDGAVIVPYSPNWSHVFQHLNRYNDLGMMATPAMPPNGDSLNRSEVEIIRNWINSGAKNFQGKYYWEKQEASTKDKLFVLNANSDLIAVTDLATNLVMRYIPVGVLPTTIEAPHYATLSPDKQFLYISLIRGGILQKFRTDTYELVATLTVGPDPSVITVSPDGNRLVVSHWNDTNGTPKLTLVNAATMTILDQLIGDGNLLSFPHGVVSNSNFSEVFVVANRGNYFAKYSMNTSSFTNEEKYPLTLSDPVPLPSSTYAPYQAVLSPDQSKLFVSCSKLDEVKVFDTQTGAPLASIPTGKFPRLMVYDNATNRLMVACASEENVAEQGSINGCISVIDAVNFTLLQKIYRVGHRPHGIDIDPSARRLYVSSENTGGIDPPHHPVSGASYPLGKYHVIDLSTLTVIKELETEVAEFPNGCIISR